MARTLENDAYLEDCRRRFMRMSPEKFGGLRPGQCVMVCCPRRAEGLCTFGSVDPEALMWHFNTTDHYDPQRDHLDADIFTPSYADEGR